MIARKIRYLICQTIISGPYRRSVMNKPNRIPLSLLAGTSLAAFGLGYSVAPDYALDREVRSASLKTGVG